MIIFESPPIQAYREGLVAALDDDPVAAAMEMASRMASQGPTAVRTCVRTLRNQGRNAPKRISFGFLNCRAHIRTVPHPFCWRVEGGDLSLSQLFNCFRATMVSRLRCGGRRTRRRSATPPPTSWRASTRCARSAARNSRSTRTSKVSQLSRANQ